jgi:hypothetical protein
LLFAGTGNGFYYSQDDGGHWTAMAAGLPHAPVSWIAVQKQFHDVVVSTYGRGFYILDDISPLEASAASDAAVQFVKPRDAYRWVRGSRAILNYSLKQNAQAAVQIQVTDASGAIVRSMTGGGRAGTNRANWDLRYDSPRLIALRTTPPENPHIWDEPRFKGQDSRPITHWGMSPNQPGPMVAPGKYTVKLIVDGQTFTQTVEVLRDPKMDPKFAGTNADLEASVKMQLRIRDDISKTSDMVNQIEWMRKQLDDVVHALRPQKDKAELAKNVEAMDQKMLAVEYKLLNKALMTSDDKYFIEAYTVYFNLLWLNGEVGPGAGDVAGGMEFGPTDTSRMLLDMIEKDLATATAEYHNLMEKEIPGFNKSLAEHGVTPLSAAVPPATGVRGNFGNPGDPDSDDDSGNLQ